MKLFVGAFLLIVYFVAHIVGNALLGAYVLMQGWNWFLLSAGFTVIDIWQALVIMTLFHLMLLGNMMTLVGISEKLQPTKKGPTQLAIKLAGMTLGYLLFWLVLAIIHRIHG